MALITHLIQINADLAGAKRAEVAIRRLRGEFKRMGVDASVTRRSTDNLSRNLGRLAGRAALTIPVWFALRGAFVALFTVFQEGGRRIAELSRALTKVAVTISGDTENLKESIAGLGEEASQLGRRFGVVTPKIVSAFQKFATSGLDVETSLAGMNAATKLSIILQGDVIKIANSLAGAFTLLGETTEQNLTIQERLTLTAAKIVTLWKDNRFEIDGLAQSFDNFLSTAKVANITLDESIVLLTTLSTAGLLGGRGGRLLRTTFAQFQKNLGEVRLQLGLVASESDRVFDTFIEALERINQLQEEGKVFKAERAFATIFGGIRGGLPAKGLVALIGKLRDGFAAINTEAGENEVVIKKLFSTLSRELKIAEEAVATQIDRFKELKIQIGEAFITGLVGGDNFADSLRRLNSTLENSISLAEKLGAVLTLPFTAAAKAGENIGKVIGDINDELANQTQQLVRAGLSGNLRSRDLETLIRKLELVQSAREQGEISFPTFEEQLGGLAVDTLLDKLKAIREGGAVVNFKIRVSEEDKALLQQATDLLKGRPGAEAGKAAEVPEPSRIDIPQRILLRGLADQLNLIEMQVNGVDELVIAGEKFNATISQIADRTNEVTRNIGEGFDLISETDLQVAALAKNWERVAELLEDSADSQKEFAEIAKAVVVLETEILEKNRQINLQRADFRGLNKQLEIIQLQAAGVDELVIKQTEFRNRVEEVADQVNLTLTAQGRQNELISAAELETALIAGNWSEVNDILKDVAGSEELVKDLAEETLDLLREQAEKMKEFSDTLKSGLRDSIAAALRGDENIFEALRSRLRDIIIDTVADSITQGITQGGAFQGFSQLLGGSLIAGQQPSAQTGANVAGQVINTAIQTGGNQAAQSMQQGIQQGGQNVGNVLSRVLSNINVNVSGAGGGGLGGGLIKGIFGGAGGLIGALPGLGGLGAGIAGFGSALAPILGPIALGLGLFSLLGAFKSKTTVTEGPTQRFQVATRIDITNKKLDVVNRNLVALRSTLETFILPESAFFSETRGVLEDQFSLSSRRGGIL